jgi:hypothetical protein
LRRELQSHPGGGGQCLALTSSGLFWRPLTGFVDTGRQPTLKAVAREARVQTALVKKQACHYLPDGPRLKPRRWSAPRVKQVPACHGPQTIPSWTAVSSHNDSPAGFILPRPGGCLFLDGPAGPLAVPWCSQRLQLTGDQPCVGLVAAGMSAKDFGGTDLWVGCPDRVPPGAPHISTNMLWFICLIMTHSMNPYY